MCRAVAIETSGRVGSIAVVRDGQVVAEEQFPHGLQHAAHIVPILDRLIRRQGWSPADVQELYLSIGPGSFTGLRIGVTLAKTLAMATGVRIIAVPSVRVLVENSPAEARHVVVVLDAKREQIYGARFERAGVEQPQATGQWLEREPAHLTSLPAMLASSPRPVHLLGEGLPYHQRFLPEADPDVYTTPPDSWPARATAVAMLGLAMSASSQFADPLTLAPIYIRRPEAEEKLDERQQARHSKRRSSND
jgi:tRNA threonylcarbamoyladenosine biosynthesis protein TsaB